MTGIGLARRGELARRPFPPGPSADFMWKGQNWIKRTTAMTGTPMFNGQWSESNVSGPDINGFVTLAISNPTGTSPSGAQISTSHRGFGYGTYTCVVGTRLDTMPHKAIVFGGMFTYDDLQTASESKNEIDMCETSAWDITADPVTIGHNYFIDDNNGDGIPEFSGDRFNETADTIHTHQTIWAPTQLTMKSYSGEGTGGALIFSTVRTASLPVPQTEQVFFNLWVYSQTGVPGPPANTATPFSVVLQDFSFIPST